VQRPQAEGALILPDCESGRAARLRGPATRPFVHIPIPMHGGLKRRRKKLFVISSYDSAPDIVNRD
jgi:hypothetical protein